MPGTISWTMSTSALFTDANNYDALFKKMTARQPVEFKFGYVTSLGDSTTEADLTLNTAKSYYSGTGYITSLELTAGNNEVASFSIEISGNGKLTLTEGA